MKKKVVVMVTAAAVTVMSLGIAAPARAQCPSGLPTLPPLATVKVENGQIRINPNGPAQDAGTLSTYATTEAGAAAQCGLNMVPWQAWCSIVLIWNAGVNRYYVYQTSTGEIVIDYGRFIADTSACT